VPTVALGTEQLIAIGVIDVPAATVSVSGFVAVCGELAESFACTLNEKLPEPELAGVPVMAPEVDSVSPAGSCPEAKLHV
jgi:hypothetical protein